MPRSTLIDCAGLESAATGTAIQTDSAAATAGAVRCRRRVRGELMAAMGTVEVNRKNPAASSPQSAIEVSGIFKAVSRPPSEKEKRRPMGRRLESGKLVECVPSRADYLPAGSIASNSTSKMRALFGPIFAPGLCSP